MWDWISKPESRAALVAALAVTATCFVSSAGVVAQDSARDLGGECLTPRYDQEAAAVIKVLDELHAAAARADSRTYFSLFHPQARFVGTAVEEEWSLLTFREYVEPHFRRGQGWKYEPESRTLGVRGRDCTWAWFDERLRSESYGTARGSGVLVKTTDGWKVEQYVLSFPIPNDLARELTGRIRAYEAARPPS